MESNSEIKKGDVVVLPSDENQRMTVNSLTTNGVECIWIEDSGIFHRELIQVEALKKWQ